ncbi:MAG: hypothetical protein LBJ98_02375 [Endomicrobium sp.]|nr:hypothetical protein [Endomicrobium sp.]
MQAKEPGEIVQIDSDHVNENGIKRYFITAIDICGRQAYAREYKTLNSDNAKVSCEVVWDIKLRAFRQTTGLNFTRVLTIT